MKYTYFNLKDFTNSSINKNDSIENYFLEWNLNKEFSLNDLSVESLYGLVQRLKNDEELFKKFIVMLYGYTNTKESLESLTSYYIDQKLIIDDQWHFSEHGKKIFLCTLTEITEEGFNKCLIT